MTKNEFDIYIKLIGLKSCIISTLNKEELVSKIFEGMPYKCEVGDITVYIDPLTYIDSEFWISCPLWKDKDGKKLKAVISPFKRPGSIFSKIIQHIRDDRYEMKIEFVNLIGDLPKEMIPILEEISNNFLYNLPNAYTILKHNWKHFLREEGRREFGLM